ncbi:hypothetical protein ACFC5Z_26805, partial [Streptomyces sp. NPDC056004]
MTARAWAELLRVSALVTVPGDALAGAAASGASPARGRAPRCPGCVGEAQRTRGRRAGGEVAVVAGG